MTAGSKPPSRKKPFLQVKHGSAVVPIYGGTVMNRTRYTVAFYLNQRRRRRTFASLDDARAEGGEPALAACWRNDK
jgi:hypothetical protein